MKFNSIWRLGLMLVMLATAVSGCKKTFDKEAGEVLDAENMYRDVYDADAAIIGLYGKFLKLADKYVLLNELRADMLSYTENADQYMQQLSTHMVSADNPYADPRPFYELILNCNDMLKNFRIMEQDNKMTDAEFSQRYSDVGAMRSFLYLQLGIHYGEVPYVTSALETVDDVKNNANFPKLKFDVLLDSLLAFSEALPFKDEYPGGSNLQVNVDGYSTTKFFINKKVLLGDLNLWKGNYNQAAVYYRQVLETGTEGTPGSRYYAMYKVGWNGSDIDHYITYSRAGDVSTLVWEPQWRYMFERGQDNGFNYEWVWVLPFDSRFNPDNSLIKLFSPIGGDYLVKPSQNALNYWASQNQIPVSGQAGVIPYDARGVFSVREIAGKPVVMKYLYNYLDYNNNTAFNPLQRNGKWFLFRQTHLHLRFAEAANRAGHHRLAYGLFNSGIASMYPAPTSDKTDYENTLFLPYPFNFDARNSGSTGVPYYRGDWYRNIGIRRRANIQDYQLASTDSTIEIENGLIQETALEDGFEGTRWADLLRIARRRNDPSFLADKVYMKLLSDGDPSASATRSKLMDPKNWYLPFKL